MLDHLIERLRSGQKPFLGEIRRHAIDAGVDFDQVKDLYKAGDMNGIADLLEAVNSN